MILKGSEVKSLQAGKVSIEGSYIDDRRGRLFLLGAHIHECGGANQFNHEPPVPVITD